MILTNTTKLTNKKTSIQTCHLKNLKRNMTCVCDMRKKYEANVTGRVKENVNQLLVLGTTDFKMMYELFKEVDQFHREKFEELKTKYQGKQNSTVAVSTINEDATNENIFLEEKQ